jgi:CAAX protease family protein
MQAETNVDTVNGSIAPRPAGRDGRSPDHGGTAREPLVAVALTAATAVAFAASHHALPAATLAVATLVFALVIGAILALSITPVRERARRGFARSPASRAAALWVLLLACYAACDAVFERPSWAALAGVTAGGLAAIAAWATPGDRARVARGIAAVLLAGLPVALARARGLPLPWGARHPLDFGMLAVGLLVAWLFVAVRPEPGIGFRLDLGVRDLAVAGAGFAAFALVGVPLGLAIGFIHYGAGPFDLARAAQALLIYVLIALPEELVFRGLVQNGLERRWPRHPARSLAVASTVFGLAHVWHAPVPNVRYVLLATLAGAAYGWVWRRTRALGASALTHAAVDWVWAALFHG